MYKHDIGYRHINGDVEGFSGWSMISKKAAQEMALRRLMRKLEQLGHTFEKSRLAEDNATAKQIFSTQERKQIVNDWKLEQV